MASSPLDIDSPKFQKTDKGERIILDALRTWEDVLLDRSPHPGRYEQHLIVFGEIEETSFPKTELPTGVTGSDLDM
jgi:hypothetical protein